MVFHGVHLVKLPVTCCCNMQFSGSGFSRFAAGGDVGNLGDETVDDSRISGHRDLKVHCFRTVNIAMNWDISFLGKSGIKTWPLVFEPSDGYLTEENSDE